MISLTSKKRVCVIGGSGFIGSHVADQLTRAGHSVRIFDRRPSPWLKTEQQMFVGDLLDSKAVESAIQGVDIVYHFAALADLNEAIAKPIETVRVNVLGTVQILEICRRHDIERFIYASSIYVYSNEGSFYRCSKQAAEHYVEEYYRAFDLEYTILRYGSLYGPRSDQSNGLYRIVHQALKNGVIRYQGSSEAMREYIHVEDAALASVKALEEEFVNQSLVLTGHQAMHVFDVLKMLAEIMGQPNAVEFTEGEYAGHYVRTPYAYQPKLGRKYTSPLHVDLGQGLLQLIDEVRRDISRLDNSHSHENRSNV